MSAAAWIGPAIVAAVISALVTGAGWLVSERQAGRREAAQRRERVRDIQTAVLAEIRAAQHRLGDLGHMRAELERVLSEHPDRELFVPRPVPTFILDAILPEIHVLPEATIDAVVLYYRQSAAIALFVDDLRGDGFRRLDPAQKSAMFRDYLDLLSYADVLGTKAVAAISRAPGRSAEGPSGPLSAEEQAAASTSRSSGPAPRRTSEDHNRDRGA